MKFSTYSWLFYGAALNSGLLFLFPASTPAKSLASLMASLPETATTANPTLEPPNITFQPSTIAVDSPNVTIAPQPPGVDSPNIAVYPLDSSVAPLSIAVYPLDSSVAPPDSSVAPPDSSVAPPDSSVDSLSIAVYPPTIAVDSPETVDPPETTVEPPPIAPTAKPDPSPSTAAPPDLAPNARQQLLIEGDRLWQQGRFEDAELFYRKAKNPFTAIAASDRPAPIYDPAQLSPGAQVYWRESQMGESLQLQTRMLTPLGLLTEQYPEFIPGHLRYADLLLASDRPEDALQGLERATTLYPNETELVRTRVTILADQRRWLEASIAARQFALLNPEQPTAPEFTALAEENLRQHRSHLRERLTGRAIANVLTGALSYALTGDLFGPFSAIQSTVLLLRGESDVGEAVAHRLVRELDLVQDEAVVAYVNEVGQRLANVAGRDEFNYEFYVVRDSELNAFTLPGGKIFINAGAILEAESEAELAGLLAHEIAHAVLSHGFQLITESNVTANVLQFIPYGGIAADLVILRYSRDMERQADALGTRMLSASGYAADGLHQLMITLEQSDQPLAPLEWLSTHPDPAERVQTMERQIEQNGYNRYAYEGVERHIEMQRRLRPLLAACRRTRKLCL